MGFTGGVWKITDPPGSNFFPIGRGLPIKADEKLSGRIKFETPTGLSGEPLINYRFLRGSLGLMIRGYVLRLQPPAAVPQLTPDRTTIFQTL
jgi:hypothetical protein